MTKKYHKLTIKINLFPTFIFIFQGKWKHLEHVLPSGVAARCTGARDYDGLSIICDRHKNKYTCLIWMEKPDYAVLAHEAAHVAAYICHEFGVLADFNNDETFCYIVGTIMKQCRPLKLK